MSFGVMAPTFLTQIVDLVDPEDVAANRTILPESPSEGSGESRWCGQAIFVQVLQGSARWRCGGAEPADDDEGHILAEGDGVIVALTIGESWWIWSAAPDTQLAISPADAVPTRAPLTRLTAA